MESSSSEDSKNSETLEILKKKNRLGMNTSFGSHHLLSFYIIPFLLFFASLFFYIAKLVYSLMCIFFNL
jgi:hypothetical protein